MIRFNMYAQSMTSMKNSYNAKRDKTEKPLSLQDYEKTNKTDMNKKENRQ